MMTSMARFFSDERSSGGTDGDASAAAAEESDDLGDEIDGGASGDPSRPTALESALARGAVRRRPRAARR